MQAHSKHEGRKTRYSPTLQEIGGDLANLITESNKNPRLLPTFQMMKHSYKIVLQVKTLMLL